MKTRVREDPVVVAVRDQVSCDLEDEAALLNLKSGVYYGLNTVGARIWALVRASITVRDILETVVAEYEAEPAAATFWPCANGWPRKGLSR